MKHSANLISVFFLSIATITSSLWSQDFDKVVIIHLNGDRIEAGFAGESVPRVNMPAVTGTSKTGMSPMIGMGGNQTYYGDEALAKTGIRITYTVQNGAVRDWQQFEKLISYVLYTKLKVDPESVAIAISEPSGQSTSQREKMTQLFFETFNVPAFYMTPHFTSYAKMQITGSSTFYETFITKDEYDETGPEVILQKSQ